MRIALYSCIPVFAAAMGEAVISTFGWRHDGLIAATFLGAMLAIPALLPMIAATARASFQERLSGTSKLVLWIVVLLALVLTLFVPSRVTNEKYYVGVTAETVRRTG